MQVQKEHECDDKKWQIRFHWPYVFLINTFPIARLKNLRLQGTCTDSLVNQTLSSRYCLPIGDYKHPLRKGQECIHSMVCSTDYTDFVYCWLALSDPKTCWLNIIGVNDTSFWVCMDPSLKMETFNLGNLKINDNDRFWIHRLLFLIFAKSV